MGLVSGSVVLGVGVLSLNVFTGFIPKQELAFAMGAAGWKPEKSAIEEILNADSEEDKVAFESYVSLMTPIIKDQDDSERYRVAFEMFDADDKGHITKEDLQRVALEIGEDMKLEEFEEMVKEASDGNRVTFDCFVKIMEFTEKTPLE